MFAKFTLPKIYPITDRMLSGVSHIEQIRSLIEGGAKFIQIRDKDATSLELFNEIGPCLKLAEQMGVRLIVNDRADIALVLKADGVHLGQGDLPAENVREILGDDAIIGFSTHNVEQAIDAADQPVNYIAIGPIFSTQTKPSHEPIVGLSGIENVRKAVGDLPIVAIGGIGFETIRDVLAAGADSVALISCLVSDSTKIVRNTQRAFAIANRI